MMPVQVVREIEEKAIKEGVSVASILKERGIKIGNFYNAKRKYDRMEASLSPQKLKLAAPLPIEKDMSLRECLSQLQKITENLNRIFRGL